MREWLIALITRWMTRMVKGSGVQQGESIEVEKHPPCPICGEDWDESEIFCYHCGYEEKDEELPLHPPPVRTGCLTDPGNLIGETTRMELSSRLAEIQNSKGIDIGIFILPPELSGFIRRGEGQDGESLDGFAFGLYNTWMMGKDTSMKGVFVAVDPFGSDRAIVTGREGPSVGGTEFRRWFDSMKFETNSPSEAISSEIRTIVENIAGL